MPNVNSIFKSNFLSNLMKEFNLFQTIENLLNEKCLCQDPSCNTVFTLENNSNFNCKLYWLHCKKDPYLKFGIKFQNNEIYILYSYVYGYFILNNNKFYYSIYSTNLTEDDLIINLNCSENQLNLIHKLIQKQEIKLIFS